MIFCGNELWAPVLLLSIVHARQLTKVVLVAVGPINWSPRAIAQGPSRLDVLGGKSLNKEGFQPLHPLLLFSFACSTTAWTCVTTTGVGGGRHHKRAHNY